MIINIEKIAFIKALPGVGRSKLNLDHFTASETALTSEHASIIKKARVAEICCF